MKKNLFPLLIIFFTGSILLASLYFSVRELMKNTERIMYQDTITITDVIELSSSRLLEAQKEIEKFYADRVLMAQELVERTGAKDSLTVSWIMSVSGISRVMIFNRKGEILYNSSSSPPEDTLLTELRRYGKGFRGVVPLESEEFYNLIFSSGERVYVVSVSKSEVLEKRVRAGIGSLLRGIGQEGRIIYLALQNEEGIIFATGNVKELESIESDTFLLGALSKETTRGRYHQLAGFKVYEVVRPFYENGKLMGLLRVGIDGDFYLSLIEITKRNIILLHLALFLLMIILTIIFLKVRRLREMLISFDTMVQNVPVGVIRFDSRGRFLSANRIAEQLLSLPHGTIKNITLEDLGFKDLKVRSINRMRDRKRHILLTLIPIFEDSKKRVGSICFIESIEAEEKLERARELEVIGEIAAQVAHEIKNPLNAISMIIQRIKSEFMIAPQNEAKELLSIVVNEIKRIEHSVNRFIGIAAPLRLKKRCVNLRQLLDEVLDLFAEELKDMSINVTKIYITDASMLLDREKMREVFVNIIKNALEAMSPGSRLRLALFRKENEVHITVRDYGEGMDEETLEKAGQPFFTTKAKGSGLGLVFVRKTVEAHGGEISIKSKKGNGTLVEVILPYDEYTRC